MPTQVTSDVIADLAVNTLEIADSAVTAVKLASNAVTTAKIADANVTPVKLSQPLTRGTAVATTSGTSVDFTGIPSWVTRITVLFNGVSTNGTSSVQVQLGTSGGVENTGYGGTVFGSQSGAVGTANFTTGFAIDNTTAGTDSRSGFLMLCHVGSNIWAASGSFGLTNSARSSFTAGTKLLANTLDRIRITANGTDTFDAGSVNILYE